jgi:hypothetical protein
MTLKEYGIDLEKERKKKNKKMKIRNHIRGTEKMERHERDWNKKKYVKT